MAKTVFSTGTIVTRQWLNGVYGATGHVHDGQDDDGHAPLITPSELTGIIPNSKVHAPYMYIAGLNIYTGDVDMGVQNLIVTPGICVDSNATNITNSSEYIKAIQDSGKNFMEFEPGTNHGCVGILNNGDLIACDVGWYRLFAVKNMQTGAFEYVVTTFADTTGAYVKNVLVKNGWSLGDIALRRIGFLNIYDAVNKQLRLQYHCNGHVTQYCQSSIKSIDTGLQDVEVDLPNVQNLPAKISVMHHPSTLGWAIYNRYNLYNVSRSFHLGVYDSGDQFYHCDCIASDGQVSLHNYEASTGNFYVDAVGYYDERTV